MSATASDLPAPYYQHGGITIYHGDCRDLMRGGLVCDHVITDPPYDEKTHAGARYGFGETSSAIPFDPLPDPAAMAGLLVASARRWVLAFCALEMFGAYRDGAGAGWVRAGFWRRTNGVPQFSGDRPGQPGEGIAIMHGPEKKRWNNKGNHAFWATPIESGARLHPTQKPLRLMCALLRDFTDRGEVVLDPFMGSGTTLRAAKDMGRRAVGVELNEAYCEAAARRLSQEVLF